MRHSDKPCFRRRRRTSVMELIAKKKIYIYNINRFNAFVFIYFKLHCNNEMLYGSQSLYNTKM